MTDRTDPQMAAAMLREERRRAARLEAELVEARRQLARARRDAARWAGRMMQLEDRLAGIADIAQGRS